MGNQRRHEQERILARTRRNLFSDSGMGLGANSQANLLEQEAGAATLREAPLEAMAPRAPEIRARAKRIIYLHMAGGPSQLELFDPKPKLQELSGQLVPKSLTDGKRFAFLKPGAKLLGTRRTFARHGSSGAVMSDLLPHLATVADDLCIVKSMATDVFNHGPAKLFMQTGSPQAGRPSMGAWVTYGLGNESRSLPGFVVLQSGPRGPRGGAVLWSSGFLPSTYQGVPFLPGASPILDMANPPGIDASRQGDFISAVTDLNRDRQHATGDPEIATRIAAYEMAYRMQASAPELMDLSQESAATLESYGATPGKSSFANNCLLARRLVERGVRFVQLYHTDWDHHGGAGADLETDLPKICREVDRPCAALVRDLIQR